MKLKRSKQDKWVFHLSSRERKLFLEVLERYPLVPVESERHRICTKEMADAEPQRLLDQALATQREENRKRVQAMLGRQGKLEETSSGYQLSLSSAEMEWLLQVLNDVRVGSWLALGSPDTENGDTIPLTARNAPHVWLMETAGYFQMEMLQALGETPH